MANEGCNALQQLDLKVVDPAQSAEDDMRLLRLYAENGDEGAFSTLVSRHMGWVLAACRRGLKDLAIRSRNCSQRLSALVWGWKSSAA